MPQSEFLVNITSFINIFGGENIKITIHLDVFF